MLVDSKIVTWTEIEYRYIGRHKARFEYDEIFDCYTLKLADVVELNPSKSQKDDLRKLMAEPSEDYYFATDKEIESHGVDTTTGNFKETIAKHTKKILETIEYERINVIDMSKPYHVSIAN